MKVTACIHYFRDSNERERNLRACVDWLRKNGIAILVLCDGHLPDFLSASSEAILSVSGAFRKDGIIHRTKALNHLMHRVRTKYAIVQDTDAIIPAEQIAESIKLLESGTDFVWPYDGTFWRMMERPSAAFAKHLNIGLLATATEERRKSVHSVGGSIFVNHQRYMECGGENEKFIGYAPEDSERWDRLSKLGSVGRVAGPLYHLHHEMLGQSRPEENPFYIQAREELKKIKAMEPKALLEYVQSWE